MNYIVKYFWSLGIIFTAVNAFILKSKMSAIDSPEESAEQKKLIAGYFSFLAIQCLLLQIFQLLGNYRTALYILYRDFSNPFYWCGVCSVLLSYFVLLVIAAFYKNIERYSQQLFRANLKRNTLIFIILGIIVFAVIIIFGFSSTINIKENVEKII